ARKSGMAGICAQGSMFSSSAPTMLAVMKTRLAGSSRYSGRVSIGPSSPVRAAGGPSRDQLLRDFGQGRAVEQERQHEAAAQIGAGKSGMAGICAQGSMFSSSAPTMLAVMKTRLAGSSRYSGRVSIGPSSPVRAAGGPSRDQLLRDFGQGRAVEQEHQHEAAA